MSESVFDNSVLRKYSVGQSALVIDTCGNDCEFEEELREVHKSCVSMAHLKRPQSLQSLPPDSIFTFVLIVADNETNSVVGEFSFHRYNFLLIIIFYSRNIQGACKCHPQSDPPPRSS